MALEQQKPSSSYTSTAATMGGPVLRSTAPLNIPGRRVKMAMDMPITSTHASPIEARMNPDCAAFSPVTDKGCFEFDRVIRSAEILKKSRRTKTYKPFYMVLRPLNLSLYGDKEHTALRHSIPLSEITAVARRRRTKRPRPGLFSVFTAERNFHFDAGANPVADSWVDQLRRSARIDEWDSGVASSEEEGDATEEQTVPTTGSIPIVRSSGAPGAPSQPFAVANMHSTPVGSFSSISSFGAANFRGSSVSLAMPVSASPDRIAVPMRPAPHRTTSAVEVEQERVLRNGRLVLLKSKGGVRKWKPVWAVLRVKSLAIYPNEDEYSPILIIPFPSIVNAVEIDSPSRNKKRQFCMQVITEERNWRFCAQDEDDLAIWLGTIKSLVAKRRAAAAAAASASASASASANGEAHHAAASAAVSMDVKQF